MSENAPVRRGSLIEGSPNRCGLRINGITRELAKFYRLPTNHRGEGCEQIDFAGWATPTAVKLALYNVQRFARPTRQNRPGGGPFWAAEVEISLPLA